MPVVKGALSDSEASGVGVHGEVSRELCAGSCFNKRTKVTLITIKHKQMKDTFYCI